jgi:hypothetical protein
MRPLESTNDITRLAENTNRFPRVSCSRDGCPVFTLGRFSVPPDGIAHPAVEPRDGG